MYALISKEQHHTVEDRLEKHTKDVRQGLLCWSGLQVQHAVYNQVVFNLHCH